ncbi:IPT/TIG domain-containing protein [Candidatus Nitronereus thalassa]|uniref:IPT/TIG domain-containing protein n=1 Tax=Candidatus Nitronereus thalassa TaxID=3020898 RepID=A0ABU3K3Z0_9BACT|nr:IPT/TIG domain-containing protein [Candidatus Nitronereus thalassa]MDT7041090.1 IPT/TIG domain-containing protein [Candidatus Nitronereus thalassa]
MKQVTCVTIFMAFICGFTNPVSAELFPASGAPGSTVTIGGGDFGEFVSTAVNRVEFNGVPALIQLWEKDLVMVKVPLEATTGPVVVLGGTNKSTMGEFTVRQVKITKIVPSEAEPGSDLTIEGENFGNTAGSRDPNTMFGVNNVLINGVKAQVKKWRPNRLEVTIPTNSKSGDVVVQLASSDPLPDGSCCAPVQYVESNPMPITLIPPISFSPTKGPIGSKVVLSGQEFGETKSPADMVLFNGKPATIADWSPRTIVVHVPLNATKGMVTLKRGGKTRNLGEFDVVESRVDKVIPEAGPIGTLLQIKGENFGVYSESGSTAYAFDFEPGQNRVEIGGVPGVIYRWQDNEIDVWVPYSAKSGPVVLKRGGMTPKPDGTCCAEKGEVELEVGHFTVLEPTVTSYSPTEAGLDEIVTIKGTGFGDFLKIAEDSRIGLHHQAHNWQNYELGADVSRSEVMINGLAALVVSWKDDEIKIRVPRRPVFGYGYPGGFHENPTKGEIVVRRGSWDLKDDGTCCQPKKWVSAVAGHFEIIPRNLPREDFYFDYTHFPERESEN